MSNDTSDMLWRDIPGYEGCYQVSDTGIVRNTGLSKGKGSRRFRLLKYSTIGHGYFSVQLWKNNQGTPFLVHRLVMLAFVGPSELHVNHKNGIRTDNRLENLEYVTAAENNRHAREMGLNDMNGESNPMSKLTLEDVQAIRAMYRPQEMGYKNIAKLYNVRWEAIRNVIKGRTWKTD